MANNSQNRRADRARYKIRQSANGRPRLTVFRSNKHIHAQIIDDVAGVTIVSASTVEKEIGSKLKAKSNIKAAETVGEAIAKKAIKAKVEAVVFDRGGNIYHGRIKALADAARKAGLQF